VDVYQVAADHSDFGHVSRFIFDNEAWGIRYLAVDTQNWLPLKGVLLAMLWIYLIDWFGSTVSTEMMRDLIRDSTVYNSAVPLERDFEKQLYVFCGKAAYWS
jgi:hypothetical protein